MSRHIAPLLALCLFLVSCLTTASAESVGLPPGRVAMLARGVNLNDWFSPWANPAGYTTSFSPEEAAFLRRAGFTVCRLPLAPDLLFDPSDPSVLKPEVRSVDRAVHMLLDAGLAVILDPIHGPSSSSEWESRLDHDPAFLRDAQSFWVALARHYAAFSTDRIFFEIMNEPHLTAREKVDSSWWQPVQASLAAAIRRGAPENTIIATGERWGGIDGLLELTPLSDPNVVYSFHWYDPFTFTHQGASWAGGVQAELADIPYPSSADAVRAAAASASDPRARSQIVRYGSESWGAARIRDGLSRAAAWAASHHVTVFCGEFGTYRKVAPPADRLRWITDVRTALESLGIEWCMWDYETDFGLVTFTEPSWRRGIVVDAACLTALGLDASQTVDTANEPTAASFAAGAVQSLDIPVSAWSRLWTRDDSAGITRVETDPSGVPIALGVEHTGARDWSLASGLRIPVTEGERLTLSSRASLSSLGGGGSLALALVARDTAGNVLDWSYASANVTAGSTGPVATTFVVGPGIATLEPRWSGSGLSQFRVEAFHLERNASGREPASRQQ